MLSPGAGRCDLGLKRTAPIILFMVVIIPWIMGGCGRVTSWFAKDEAGSRPEQQIEKPAETTEQSPAGNRPEDLESQPAKPEETPRESGTAVESLPEPRTDPPVEERSLEERVHDQSISQAESELHQIERIGDDLALKLFLDRLNANVGRISFGDLVKKWGLPQELADGGTVVMATWRWLTSTGGQAPASQVEDAAPTEKHGEQVTLSFDKSSQILVNWQYGRW